MPLKRSRIRPVSSKGRKMLADDDKFYESIWNSREHICEECGCGLGEDFRDSAGRVAFRWRYSHILAKSANPHLRHNPLNINLLCLKHHMQWETGDRESMAIYNDNVGRIEEMKAYRK